MLGMNAKMMGWLMAFGVLAMVSASAQHENYDNDPRAQRNFQTVKVNLLRGEPFRAVTNQVFNAEKSALWKVVNGRVSSKSDGVLILYYEHSDAPRSGRYFAVTNFVGDATDNKRIMTVAMRVGETQFGNTPVELWDCGTKLKPVAARPATRPSN